MFQSKLEELVDQCEIKKTSKPELEPVFSDVENTLGDTSKQAREISKAAAAVMNQKVSIQDGTVVLTENL